MGLINWLKNKFFKKKEEPSEAKKDEVKPEDIELPKKENVEEASLKKNEEVLKVEEKENPSLDEAKAEDNSVVTDSETQVVVSKFEETNNSSSDEVKAEDNVETTDNDTKIEILKPEEKEPKSEASSNEINEELNKKQELNVSSNEIENVNASSSEEVDHETKIYNLGLAKSREGFGARLNSIANKYKKANSDYFDELERCLIEADVGVSLTMNVLDETESMAATQHVDDPKVINDLLVDNLFMNYAKAGESFQTEIQFDPDNPTVLLVVGVNGTGKTTTIAKLAKRYKNEGKRVLLVAADTFRAGAVEQLSIWAKRVGVDIFERGQGADPASVCFDATQKAIKEKYDLVIVDTAGRLHTKDYLMAELGKIVRVIKKVLPVAPQEIWLALDANTGQNGVQQAKVFKEVTELTGVIITKMDGTSKGGIILAIRDQLGVPVRFIGLGEHEDDLREFDLDRYLYALLVGEDSKDGE